MESLLLRLAAFLSFLVLLIPTAVVTTLASSAVLAVRLVAGYSGLALAMARRAVGALAFPRAGYLVSGDSSSFDPRDPSLVNCSTTTENELAAAVASLKVKVMSRDVGRRRRPTVPVGEMRVDYGTLLRSPGSREDHFGNWDGIRANT